MTPLQMCAAMASHHSSVLQQKVLMCMILACDAFELNKNLNLTFFNAIKSYYEKK